MATASSNTVKRNSTVIVDRERMGRVGNRVSTAVEVS